MEAQKLSNILNNIYSRQLMYSDLTKFIEFMFKKLNPDKIYNTDVVEKLFIMEELLHVVIAHYLSIIEENPKEYGLKYIKIYNKNGSLVKQKEVLGTISDPFGEFEKKIKSNCNGYIFGVNTAPIVNKGDALFHIATKYS